MEEILVLATPIEQVVAHATRFLQVAIFKLVATLLVAFQVANAHYALVEVVQRLDVPTKYKV